MAAVASPVDVVMVGGAIRLFQESLAFTMQN